MRKRSIWTVALFLGVFLAATVSSPAQWRRFGPRADRGLGLSDEQLAKIQEIRLGFQEKMMPLRLQWHKAHAKLDSLEMKGAGQKELDSANELLDRLERDIEKAYQDHRSEVRNLLTEEQRAIFDRFGGLGLGAGFGAGPRWETRQERGRDYGRGWGTGIMKGYRSGWEPGWGPGCGRGWGRGLGQGYLSPWFRRR